jgi:exoribonuclease R
MTTFKIHIMDRNYHSWKVMPDNVVLNPFENKLFDEDEFILDQNNNTIVISSKVKNIKIPGVLVLLGNKTYGKQLKGDKSMYKFIPDNSKLPYFLIPYTIKHMAFSKVLNNLYAVIVFKEWKSKHPIGMLDQIIGNVNLVENFYIHQLNCKKLNITVNDLKKHTTSILENINESELIKRILLQYPSIENRTEDKNIISIDPINSKDFDDAVSITELPNNLIRLSIYISNVSIIIDNLQLWEHLSERISTIYLPNKNYTMLPDVLCNNLCSLKENIERVAFAMDLLIENNVIIDMQLKNVLIKVSNNYCYEDISLLQDSRYNKLLNITKKLNETYNYTIIHDSHDVICYLMILMNHNCANKLLSYKCGIFRNTILKTNNNIIPLHLPSDTYKFMKNWNSINGQYIDISQQTMDLTHNVLNLNAYIHITSPIRRMVDLLNMIKLQDVHNIIILREDANKFYDKWVNKLDYINITMRSIRKVQNDCELLNKFYKNPDILTTEYIGYLFDKTIRIDDLIQYNVYIHELKLIKKIMIREDFMNYDCKKIKLYLFHNENDLKLKLRVQLMS